MKTYYYMSSRCTGVHEIRATCHWAAWASVKSWYSKNTTFVIWDENDEIRIFHGE